MWSYSIFFSTTNRIFLGFCGSQRYLNLTTLKKTKLIIVYILENLIIWEISLLYFLNGMTKKDNPKNEDPDEKEKKFLEKIEEEINILRILKERNEENFYGERKDLLNKIAIKLTELEKLKIDLIKV